MEPKIIFQNENYLVLDKPSGWVVNDADSAKHLNTVQSWLEKNFEYDLSKNRELRSGIVHRLDKDTSGLLLIAKTKQAFENLQNQFKLRTVKKTYLALVHGEVKDKNGEINAPTGRLPWNRRKFGVLPGGREAITRYRVITNYQLPISNEKYTLLEIFPKTGRTHQIRIHLKHLGHPIVADKAYVGRKNWRHDSAWCPRLFLHAAKISFNDINSDKKTSFESALPKDLTDSLKHLA